jgi:hypothetical protein
LAETLLVTELPLLEPLVDAVDDAPDPEVLAVVSGSVEHAPSRAATAIRLKIFVRISYFP